MILPPIISTNDFVIARPSPVPSVVVFFSTSNLSNLVNNLDCIYGSLIWVAFIDQNKPSDKTKDPNPAKEIRCRLRSRHVNINDIASHYRGGGHLQAAGATIYSKKEMNSLIEEADALIKSYKESNDDWI